MISLAEINIELQKIEGQVSDSSFGIRHVGELALQSLSRAQSDFSDQQVGRTLVNALSLICASCDDAANSIGQVSIETHNVSSTLMR